MRETQLHRELLVAFRAAGCFLAKWPDQLVHRGKGPMEMDGTGKMRFILPKPADLIGCSPAGRFMLLEAKLARAPLFRVDARLVRQIEMLRQIQTLGGFAALVINWRYQRKRPPARVNRAVWFADFVSGWAEGERWSVPPAPVDTELRRIAGGWALPPMLEKELKGTPALQQRVEALEKALRLRIEASNATAVIAALREGRDANL